MAARKKAAAKKAAPKKVAPSARPGALQRDTSLTPDPLDPSRPLPPRPPEFRDMSPALQREVTRRVSDAGKSAYGRPVRMEDAVQQRVDAVTSIVSSSRSGVPRSLGWYPEHQTSIVDIGKSTDHNPASTADASAIMSVRNSPDNELKAARSAAVIATNPNTILNVDPTLATDVTAGVTPRTPLDKPVSSGNLRLGDLTEQQVSHLSFAGGPRAEQKGSNPVPARQARLSPDVTDLASFSQSRSTAAKGLLAARGESLDSVMGPSPKVRSYRRNISLQGVGEAAYNAEVLLRRRDQQAMPGQGSFFTASELTQFDPSTADTSTAEDYVMNAMTVNNAIKRSQGRSATTASVASVSRQAAEDFGKAVKKGKQGEGLPVDLETEEAVHSFNNAATQEAARRISTTSILPGGREVVEALTPGGIQPTAWTWHRSQNLKEDDAFNAQSTRADQLSSAKGKLQAAQGFFDFSDTDNPQSVRGKKPRFTKEEKFEMFESNRGNPALHPNDPDSDFYG